MPSIFLSHNSNDKKFVRKLGVYLLQNDIKAWIDEAEISVGDSLLNKIEIAIKECDYLGVILSNNSINSEWVKREVYIALTEEIHGRKVKVLPILIEECQIPLFLSDKLYANFINDFNTGFETLYRSIKKHSTPEKQEDQNILYLISKELSLWEVSNYSDDLLLNKEKIKLALTANPKSYLTENLLEYLLLSFNKIFFWLPEKEMVSIIRFLTTIVKDKTFVNVYKRLILSQPKKTNWLYKIGIEVDSKELNSILKDALLQISDSGIRNIILKGFFNKGIKLTKSEITHINKVEKYWINKAYLIKYQKLKKQVLFFNDGLQFSSQIATLLEENGYSVVECKLNYKSDEFNLTNDVIDAFEVILLTKGEHFSQNRNEQFYNTLVAFVEKGGTLISTPWVSWETRFNQKFREILPFKHKNSEFTEGKNIVIKKNIHHPPLIDDHENSYKIRASFETLMANLINSKTLIETNEAVPIMGYRCFGRGITIYINLTQHSCFERIKSPLDNYGFYNLFKKNLLNLLD